MDKRDYDAIVVGSGPNGFAAAIRMQLAGLSVLLVEGSDEIGGGMRSAALTLPGFTHDVCSAIHALAVISPYFSTLNLEAHGLKMMYPEIDAAHPFDDGSAAILKRSLTETASLLGSDAGAYERIMGPLVKNWNSIAPGILGPFEIPKHPLDMAAFGLKALQPATWLANEFKTTKARGLFAGMAAHSIQPLSNVATSAFGMVLLAAGHIGGWPVPEGGAVSIANALRRLFEQAGGKIQTGFLVKSLDQLPSAHAVLFDVTPKQLLQIAGHKFSSLYRWQLNRYRYGMGVFKVDWALDAAIPFTAPECRKAGTVHLGNSFEEIQAGEQFASDGGHPDKPFVLLAQQSMIDRSRAPEGKHTAWAYCHVPNGSTKNMTAEIENQIERFAPGFKSTILARHTFDTEALEAYNPNYIGGDINGGIMNVTQLFTRPVLRRSPYTTSAKGIYICSSATPPGGGVHGMCGYHAADKALKEIFRISSNTL